MTPRTRILRLHLPKDGQDTPVCYVHRKGGNASCINGEPGHIRIVPAGTPLNRSGDDPDCGLIIVASLPAQQKAMDHGFMSFGDGEIILKTSPLASTERSLEGEVVLPGFLTVSQAFESWKPIRVGVLTISDKGSRGERKDTAGPALEELVSGIGGETVLRQIVPDEPDIIEQTVKDWTGQDCHLILTTGGTGLSLRDVTPDTLLKIADREVPGLGEYIRMTTAAGTPRAILSRTVAVTLQRTLAISFPGSERGARECFESIAPVLRHAVEILRGWDGECGGHRHHH